MTLQHSKSIPPNHWYAIFSVALVLVLLGFFGMILFQSSVWVKKIKENINIVLEIKDDSSETKIASLQISLAQKSYVLPNTIQFISKERALESLRADFGDEFMQLDMLNPLYHTLTFHVQSEFLQTDALSQMRTRLKDEFPLIRDVYYQENMIEQVAQNIFKIAWIGIVIGLFFMFVAIYLMHNTTRLALYSKRFLIKNMELVGASWSFISRPFFVQSLYHGMLSTLIAMTILLGVFYWLDQQIAAISFFEPISVWYVLFMFLLVMGLFVCGLSTYRVVRKYLKMRLDDLY